jgi:methionine sulfoxide reductase catalytic subunit
MQIRKLADIPSSEITPRSGYECYMNRRKFLRGAVSGVVAAGASALGAERLSELVSPRIGALAGTKLDTVKSPLTTTGEDLTSLNDLTHYNNFYEFGVQKNEPALNAGVLPTRPWTVKVDGKVKSPKTFDIEALLKLRPLEDRVYRHRCVEAWSMVIPWVGYSLSEFIKQCEPLSSAKYVQFLSIDDPKQEPALFGVNLDWPYSEGLRMDEAMHPLALLTFGLYGQTLPNQDGAPVRIVLPWKYGYKSAKSLVHIRFVKGQPRTTWNEASPQMYGFYSNVNPDVDTVPWSQKFERVIGAPFWKARQPTVLFNGYGDQVADLYKGMNLGRDY